jgi:NAD(P)-dependent dehydrogenase (short-subunit alcohol dehydrogenase family)
VNDLPSMSTADASGWRGLPSVVDEIETMGRRAIGVAADVSDASQVDDMVQQVLARFGHLDILINNAGSQPGRDRVPVVEMDENAWDLVQRVNVRGTFLCSRAAARAMLNQGRGGKIIMLSSTKGKQGAARHAAYAASKFAVIGFAQSLALELAPFKINVNTICPGMVDTERLHQNAAAMASESDSADEAHSRMIRERAAQVPLGRIAVGEDIANVAAFLASSQSDYLTGTAITVNGGTQLS